MKVVAVLSSGKEIGQLDGMVNNNSRLSYSRI